MATCPRSRLVELRTARVELTGRITMLHCMPMSRQRDAEIWSLEENLDLLDHALFEVEAQMRFVPAPTIDDADPRNV